MSVARPAFRPHGTRTTLSCSLTIALLLSFLNLTTTKPAHLDGDSSDQDTFETCCYAVSARISFWCQGTNVLRQRLRSHRSAMMVRCCCVRRQRADGRQKSFLACTIKTGAFDFIGWKSSLDTGPCSHPGPGASKDLMQCDPRRNAALSHMRLRLAVHLSRQQRRDMPAELTKVQSPTTSIIPRLSAQGCLAPLVLLQCPLRGALRSRHDRAGSLAQPT